MSSEAVRIHSGTSPVSAGDCGGCSSGRLAIFVYVSLCMLGVVPDMSLGIGVSYSDNSLFLRVRLLFAACQRAQVLGLCVFLCVMVSVVLP